jgi:hypothetical protein
MDNKINNINNNTSPMLTAKQVAKILSVSPAWVYSHRHALGGIQLEHHSAVRFFDNFIEIIKDKSDELYDEKRQMARKPDDTRHCKDKGLFNKTGGQKVGSVAERRTVAGEGLNDPYKLLA